MSPRKRAAPRGGGLDESGTSQKSARSDAYELSQSYVAAPAAHHTADRRRSFVLPALAACQSLPGFEETERAAADGSGAWTLPLLPQPPPSFASAGAPDQLGPGAVPAAASRNRGSSAKEIDDCRAAQQMQGSEAGFGSVEPVAAEGRPAKTADVLLMPRHTGRRRSSFGYGRVSLRLADPPNTAGSPVDSCSSATPSFEQQLKAHARACMQQAVSRLSATMPDLLDSTQQFLVEACETSDRAIDCAGGDEHLSDSSALTSASPQPLGDAIFFHWLNLTLSRECRQWESLLQAHRANADRAQAELETAVAGGRQAVCSATACVLTAPDQRSTGSATASRLELTEAIRSAHVQAVLAGQRLSRAVSVARRLELVASAQASESARQLAMAAIPETPRRLLSRVLGNR